MISPAILSQAESSVQTSWWDAPWLGNLITALATIAGIALTQYLVNRRERRHHWTERKLDAYAEFLHAASIVADYFQDFRTDEASQKNVRELPFPRIQQAANLIRILAPRRVHAACHALSQEIIKMSDECARLLESEEQDPRVVIARTRSRMQSMSATVEAHIAEVLRVVKVDMDVSDRTRLGFTRRE